jgi:hypothetical protein
LTFGFPRPLKEVFAKNSSLISHGWQAVQIFFESVSNPSLTADTFRGVDEVYRNHKEDLWPNIYLSRRATRTTLRAAKSSWSLSTASAHATTARHCFSCRTAVLNARHGALHSEVYRTLAQNGVAVLADSFSLRERAIGRIAEGVKIAEIDQFVDLMLEPQTKAIWN